MRSPQARSPQTGVPATRTLRRGVEARKTAVTAVAALVTWLLPALCAAQDLTPRAYVSVPITSNAVVLTYAFADGELVFDPTVPIEDAVGTIHTPVVTYVHQFSFFGRSANVSGSLPFASG